MGTDNANIARRYMSEVWAKGNTSAIDELVGKDIVVRDTMGTDIKGIDKVKEMVKMMSSSFTDNAFTVDDVIVAGDRVVICSTWQGTHRGDFFGIAGTGARLKNPCVDVLRISNGKVVEDIGYMDTYSLFQQLGALPPRDRLARPTQPGARDDARATPRH